MKSTRRFYLLLGKGCRCRLGTAPEQKRQLTPSSVPSTRPGVTVRGSDLAGTCRCNSEYDLALKINNGVHEPNTELHLPSGTHTPACFLL